MRYVLWIVLAFIGLLGVYVWALYAPYDLPQCTNANPIFDSCRPGDRAYDAELVKQLNRVGYGKAYFTIGPYFRKDNRDYINVHIQGAGLCTNGILDITGRKEMEHLVKVKGMSYCGAVLADLEYTIDSSNGRYNFIFQHTSWIVD